MALCRLGDILSYRDARRVREFRLPAGDNHITRLQSTHRFNPTRSLRPNRDLDFLSRFILYREHFGDACESRHRFERYCESLICCADDDIGFGEATMFEPVLRVGNVNFDIERAALGIDGWIDPRDLSGKHFVRIRLDANLDIQSHLHLRHVPFGNHYMQFEHIIHDKFKHRC